MELDVFIYMKDQLEIQHYHKSDQIEKGMPSFAIQPI